jgi:ComF family protein
LSGRCRRIGSAILNLLFPDDCRICGTPLKDVARAPVCRSCLSLPAPLASEYFCVSCRTPFANSFPLDASGRCALCRSSLRGFDAAYCFGAYDGALRELIHLFKYERIRTLARPLSDFLAFAYPREERFDAIVAMPLHWRRYWDRGFNQSALLARELGRRCGIPVIRAVRRRRATPSQAGLSHAQRRANVSGAFAPARARPVNGLRILLVDDVMTTGATASACAASLKRGGARYVAVLTLARADRRFGAPAALEGAA